MPTLAFGAILGSLCAEGMIATGLLEPDHYILIVALGIAAFLGATSRIPLTACVFAVETLAGTNNVLAFIIAITVAFLIVKLSRVEDFSDAVLAAKEHSVRKGSKPTVVVVALSVSNNSFVVGKELCDILWPNACKVISFEHTCDGYDSKEIRSGDIITVRYKTYDPAATAEEITALVGIQSGQTQHAMVP